MSDQTAVRGPVRQWSGRAHPSGLCWLFVSCFPSMAWGCQGCTERLNCSPGFLWFCRCCGRSRCSQPTRGGRLPAAIQNPRGSQGCRPSNPRPEFDHRDARRSTRRQAVPTVCFVRLVFSVGYFATVCSSGETNVGVDGESFAALLFLSPKSYESSQHGGAQPSSDCVRARRTPAISSRRAVSFEPGLRRVRGRRGADSRRNVFADVKAPVRMSCALPDDAQLRSAFADYLARAADLRCFALPSAFTVSAFLVREARQKRLARHVNDAFICVTLTIMEENLKSVRITHAGRPLTVTVQTDKYLHGGNLAVRLMDEAHGMYYATLSTNVEGVSLSDDEFVFKNYSENEGLLEAMVGAGVVEMTGRSCDLGQICRLKRADGPKSNGVQE
jgi:hypothetical protein